LLLRKERPDSARSQQQHQRPSSARPASAGSKAAVATSAQAAKKFNPPPFVNAPAPSGRTFDEMQEIQQNGALRKKRAGSAQTARLYPARSNSPTSNNQNQHVDPKMNAFDNNNNNVNGLAVVYDEAVPASHLSPAGNNSTRRVESVYDMVMPQARNNINTNQLNSSTGMLPPQAMSQGPPVHPQPRPVLNQQQQQQQQQHQEIVAQLPPTNNAAVNNNTNGERSKTGKRFPRSLYSNSHINIFGQPGAGGGTGLEEDEVCGGATVQGYPNTGRRRHSTRTQNPPTTILGGAQEPLNYIKEEQENTAAATTNQKRNNQQQEIAAP
jgi:hypothetical protein